MKCVIMAGGKGSRARPFTNHSPKAMMPAEGIPVIERITDHIESSGVISDIIIVADMVGLGAQICHHYAGRPNITFVQDTGSGTAGDLRHAPIDNESEFLLWFCDNLCALNIEAMIRHYRTCGTAACVATRHLRPEETGFADVKNGIITRFREKPVISMPYHQCLGIYILNNSIYRTIKDSSGPLDLSYDILQHLPRNGGGISAYDIDTTPWLDAESPGVLERNRDILLKIISQMDTPRSPQRH